MESVVFIKIYKPANVNGSSSIIINQLIYKNVTCSHFEYCHSQPIDKNLIAILTAHIQQYSTGESTNYELDGISAPVILIIKSSQQKRVTWPLPAEKCPLSYYFPCSFYLWRQGQVFNDFIFLQLEDCIYRLKGLFSWLIVRVYIVLIWNTIIQNAYIVKIVNL